MMKRIGVVVVAVLLLACASIPVSAAESYDNYVYDSNATPQQEPQAYVPKNVVTGGSIGTVEFNSPKDILVTDDGKIYVADTGNNRIVVMNSLTELDRVIDSFQNGDRTDTFNGPQGVFVTDDHQLYVADTKNGRIVRLNENGELIAIYGVPTSSLYSTQYAYEPIKLVVDAADRMYVVSLNSSQGIIELDADGKFMAYFGAITTTPSLGQILRRMLPFDFLKDTGELNIPTEYSSVAIDELDMVYGTVGIIDGEDFDPSQFIHRLNPSGVDILKRNGTNPPMGDVQLQYDEDGETMLTSYLCDITVRPNGVYSVLDQRLGRVFTYNADGELMYIFGAKGESMGQVSIPAALDVYGELYLVLDSQLNQIVVYKATTYGECINMAMEAYFNKDYAASGDKWNEALSYTSKSSLVYNGVADSAYKEGNYERALYYYKLAQNRDGYSKAYKYVRQQWLDKSFTWIFIVIILLIVGLVAWSMISSRRQKKEKAESRTLWGTLKYSLYVMCHPFKGFWDLKHEKRGSMGASLLLVLGVIIILIMHRQMTGFVINTNDVTDMNIIVQVAMVVLPLLLWTVGNWAITTLMDGEGNMKDIFMTTCYALTPIILFNIPMLILSNVLTLEEMTLYTLLDVISVVWVVFLIIVGIMTVHQFSMGKTIVTIILAVVSMAVLAAIGLLLVSLVQQMVNFVEICIFEFSMR